MFNLYSFLTYAFITSYTPGPNNITSLSNASVVGFRKGLKFNLGVFVGISTVMLLSAAFGAVLFEFVPAVKPYMLFAGAAYMLYLAYKTYKSSGEIEMKDSNGVGFVSGVLLQFINPKCIIYCLTLMSTYILPNFKSPFAIAGLGILLSFISFSSTVCWAAFGAAFYNLFSKRAKLVNTVMALLLVYCAVSLFL